MKNILTDIVHPIRRALVARKKSVPEAILAEQILSQSPRPRPDFAAAFKPDRFNVIAELKKASPSKGVIRSNFDPFSCAASLERGGAAALSVLTEENFFQGSLNNLDSARRACSLPLLRKDFILDRYQIYEAALHHASAVLLIAALLDDGEVASLLETARLCGLSVLAEAHTADEVERLVASGCRIIGINARDLKTFTTDLNRSCAMLAGIPDDCIAIAESAIESHADLVRLREAGANGFLIGETLMRAPDPGAKLRELLEE